MSQPKEYVIMWPDGELFVEDYLFMLVLMRDAGLEFEVLGEL